MIPYVTPSDLLGDPTAPPSVTGPSDQVTLGINFNQIATERLWEMCYTATAMVDAIAAQTLRGSSVYEELSGPAHRLGLTPMGLRFITVRKPLLAAVMGQFSTGQPPWTWNPITLANIVPEQPPLTDFSSASWEAADPGMASFLIGNVAWAMCPIRVGLRYLAGWPITGLTPAATTQATFTASSDSITVTDATGIAVGAPVSATLLPAGTTVTAIAGTTVTLSATATGSGSGTLTVGYAPGVTSLNVDDITTWGLGIRGTIFDGTYTESATSTAVTGATMTPTPTGPGTVTLAEPTTYGHLPGVAWSAMPGAVRWATMLAVKVQALERGSTAVVAQATPGRSTSAGGSAISRTNDTILKLLLPYRRAY